MKRTRAGRGMIEMVVVAAVVLVGVIVYVNGGFPGLTGKAADKRKDGVGETVVGRSLAAGKDTKCQSNLKQVRMAIQIGTDPVEEVAPSSLKDLKLGADYEACPLGKEPYLYDPATGQVKCVHLGHENY